MKNNYFTTEKILYSPQSRKPVPPFESGCSCIIDAVLSVGCAVMEEVESLKF